MKKSAMPVVLEKEHHYPDVFSFTMKIGEWKRMFEPGYFKLLIAGSLNEVVREHEFRNSIAGYLLTDRRLCLVLVTYERVMKRMFTCLNEKLMEAILLSLDEMPDKKIKDIPIEEPARREDVFEPLFIKYPLENEELIRLITGRNVKLPYYSASLARLKNQIRNYPFCSAIDYGGAESPVLVRIISRKEWREIEYWQKEKHRR